MGGALSYYELAARPVKNSKKRRLVSVKDFMIPKKIPYE